MLNRLDKLIVTICAIGALLCCVGIARGQSFYANSIPAPKECLHKAERTVSLEKSQYIVSYFYSSCHSSTPATNPPGQPHYSAEIEVLELKAGKRLLVGKSMQGIYVKEGCWEDIPLEWIKLARAEATMKLPEKKK